MANKKTVKAPSGLSITRNGKKFTFRWKTHSYDAQELEYKIGGVEVLKKIVTPSGAPKWMPFPFGWKSIKVKKGSTAKSIKVALREREDKDLVGTPTYIKFRVRGHKNKKWTDWTKETFDIKKPKKPSVRTELLSEFKSRFVWSIPANDDDKYIFTDYEWQSVLSKDAAKPKWKDADTGSGTQAAYSWSKEEKGWSGKDFSYTRWFRVRAIGPQGNSDWAEAHHTYARSHRAMNVKAKATAKKGGGYTISMSWDTPNTKAHPVDKVTVRYMIAPPASTVEADSGTMVTTLSCPVSGSWNDINPLGSRSGQRKLAFPIGTDLQPDEAIFVRVDTIHDADSSLIEGTPVLVTNGLGRLSDPTQLVVGDIDMQTRRVTVSVQNNSSIEAAFIALYFRTSKRASDNRVIGIIPHNESSATIQLPTWGNDEQISIGAKAVVGDYRPINPSSTGVTTYTITNERMNSDINWSVGVPLPPSKVTVNPIESGDGVMVGWGWSWAEATAAELSWSENKNAWESTDEPSTYVVNNVHASRWIISGLSPSEWYVRVRLLRQVGDETVYGTYSPIISVKLSMSPSTPSLMLNPTIITKDGSTTATWAFVSNDGTTQQQAEIAEVIEQNGVITYHDLSPKEVATTASHLTISAEAHGWQPGETHNLAVRVTSMSGETSEGWSPAQTLTIAEAITAKIEDTSLVSLETVDDPDISKETISGNPIVYENDNEFRVIKSLVAHIDPKQDGTPWIDTEEYNNPYLSQDMPTLSNDYNTEYLKKIVGGSLVWNQLVRIPNGTKTDRGITAMSNVDTGVITFSGTSTTSYAAVFDNFGAVKGHKYIRTYKVLTNPNSVTIRHNAFDINWNGIYEMVNASDSINTSCGISGFTSGTVLDGITMKANIFDLTAMFGTTIADYIYNLEQTTAGAGVEFFKKLFPDDYYPYNSGELMSVQTSAHVTKSGNGQTIESYPLDSSLTLRGIPKIADDKLYYDGDEYKSSGEVTRKYGVVDLGTLNWVADGTSGLYISTNFKQAKYVGNLICSKYLCVKTDVSSTLTDKSMVVGNSQAYPILRIKDSSYAGATATAFKTAMNGVMLVYELATPTTETAQPYTKAQTVDPSGTEKFVSNEIIPVGHVSSFANVCPISGSTEVNANRTGVNVWDEEWEQGVINISTGALSSNTNTIRSKTYCPILPSTTYYMTCGKTDGGSQNRYYLGIVFYDEDKNFISGAYYNNLTFETPANARYFKIVTNTSTVVYGGTYNHDIAINYPSTDTDYHAYDGTTYTTALGRTVYGGTVDIVSGELVVDRAMVDLGSLHWNYSANAFFYANQAGLKPLANWSVVSHILSDRYEATFPDNVATVSHADFVISSNPAGNQILIADSRYTDATSFKTASSGAIAVYELATPQTYQLTMQQVDLLLGYNRIETDAQSMDITFTSSVTIEPNCLTKFPLVVKATGCGEGGSMTYIIERYEDYHVDRPDDTEYNGFEGETILFKTVNGEDQIEIYQSDLIGNQVSEDELRPRPKAYLDDTAKYNLFVIARDSYNQIDTSDKIKFVVNWEHQAVQPSAIVEPDRERHVTYITPVAPAEGYEDGDTCDIYRLSADKPELIIENAQFGTKYVDPYPTLGEFGGHRIVYKTYNGDYITKDNEIAWNDYTADDPAYRHDLFAIIIDFDGKQLILPYDVSVSNSWSKDFTETKYLGGTVRGDWNVAVSKQASLSTNIPVEYEPDNVELIRALAIYPGLCHVRTPEGSSYAANVNVQDEREEKMVNRLAKISLDITKVDSEGFDGMTFEKWSQVIE